MQDSARRASDIMKLGEMSVGDLSNTVGISQSLVSQHLARMRREGVVVSRRAAQVVFYSLQEGETARLISDVYDIFCEDP